MRPTRLAALILGALLLLPALGVLLGGVALGSIAAIGREDGWFEAGLEPVTTDTFALVTDDLTFEAEPGSPDLLLERIDLDVRLRATGADPDRALFIGITRSDDLARFVDGVAVDEIVRVDGSRIEVDRRDGTGAARPPAGTSVWAASDTGTGTVELVWPAQPGSWSAVLMNADATAGLSADVDVAVRSDDLFTVVLVLILGGALLVAASVALLVAGARATSTDVASAPRRTAPPYPGEQDHPLRMTASLDDGLSRWRWLVKWFLAIPHFLVLALLSLVFIGAGIAASVSVIVTGRFPRRLFVLNEGILRWSWRVAHYATTGGLGTDRYPPFALGPRPNDAATLTIDRPDRIARWRPLVHWLLAVPHLIVVALLVGPTIRWATGDGTAVELVGGGVLGLLALAAGLVLLTTGGIPRGLFDLIVGLNRWVYRTIAYVAVMTDRYPPFRLDPGPDEPNVDSPSPLPPPTTGSGRPSSESADRSQELVDVAAPAGP